MGGEPSHPAETQDEDPRPLEGGGQLLQGQLYRPLSGGESCSEKTDEM